MSSSGKGDETTSEIKLPDYIDDASRSNLKLADQVSSIGAIIPNGPTIAGFSPQQIAAMTGTSMAADAFGMPSAGANTSMTPDQQYKTLTGIDAPQDGGHSSYGITQMLINSLPPAQRAAIESYAMNPQTGAAPTNTQAAQNFETVAGTEVGEAAEAARTAAAANASRRQARRDLRRKQKQSKAYQVKHGGTFGGNARWS